ncbi:MAG: FGGY-family carbohydrate kinase [Cyanobacteria bacterium J06623_4]
MHALGIDFGTSGARAIAIDSGGQAVAQARYHLSSSEVQQPASWQQALWQLLSDLPVACRHQLRRIAVNGTSATVLLCDCTTQPLTPALLYNDATARSALPTVEAVAPPGSPTCSATSSLVKALWWYENLDSEVRSQVSYLAHQADWIASLLHGKPAVSDYHNALKVGYDVRSLSYPDWLLNLPVSGWLPTVKTPGDIVATILPELAQRFEIHSDCQICAGTTDSIGAFMASGAHRLGQAVTSLGSTLVLKLLNDTPVDNQNYGVYSHRFGDLWLVGGASNTGGAVLQQFFSAEQLSELSAQIDISQPCPLNYYPLTSPGERFPHNDPDYAPRLTPRPAEDTAFLYGLLDAIARIEAEGYQKLHALGAVSVQQVYTAGGGAQNQIWQQLRQRQLGSMLLGAVVVTTAANTEAAYGTAQLALKGLFPYQTR